MLPFILSILVGVVLIWIVWRLLRLVLAVIIVAVLVAFGIGAVHRFELRDGRSTTAHLAAVGHTFSHDAQRIEHSVTRH